jgi:NAD(P)-dependent dehydrogenase (short-subunit alcohol dehydrogenase family)
MLAGKTIIITGSGSGIGRAAARLFAEAGAQLMLADQNESGVQETATMVTDAGGTALARKMDVRKEVEVRALVEATIDAYGRLDGAYNNAGVQMIAGLLESPEFRPRYGAALARHTIGHFGEPEDVAYVARFLLSDQSAFVNGAAIAVDVGYTAC